MKFAKSKVTKRKCVYCNDPATTRDHVPPQSLFPNPKPSNLITVDCCKKCNSSFQLDDEYFMTILSFNDAVGEHKSGSKLLKKGHRILNYKRKIPLLKSIIDTMKMVGVTTPAGIYLGETGTYTVDNQRLRKTMIRITKGLYFHEMGKIIPVDLDYVYCDRSNLDTSNIEAQKLYYMLIRELKAKEKKVIGDDVFAYSYRVFEENEGVSIWLFVFFEHIDFFVLTRPMDLI